MTSPRGAYEAAEVVVSRADLALYVAYHRSGHAHSTPGVWDSDNRPGVAGETCTYCPAYERLRAVVGPLPKEARP